MSHLIRVESLSVSAGEEVLVEPVSFTLDKGKPLTILGETGAGKKPDCSRANGNFTERAFRQRANLS
ncbi:hypothetical protein QW180_01550 [Vibrio sinaloensis]|nr:hypothetical protein [Vibrio sinaloensis]